MTEKLTFCPAEADMSFGWAEMETAFGASTVSLAELLRTAPAVLDATARK